MITINDIMKIYNDALSVDYGIYNTDLSEIKEYVNANLDNIKSNDETNDIGSEFDSNEAFYNLNELMIWYFLHLTKVGGTFCDEALIEQYVCNLTEMGCNKNEQPFYNIARTYWTLKVLVFYLIFPDSDDEVKFCIATKMLQQIELQMATYFFPSMGGAGISNADRQKNTKIELSDYNVYSGNELDNIFTQIPLYKNAKKSGCFIATATYGSPLAEEVFVLKEWRDNYLLHSYIGRLFVKIYYKVSPPIAKLIEKSSLLKLIFRGLLYPTVKLINRKEE